MNLTDRFAKELREYCREHKHLDVCNCEVVYMAGLINMAGRYEDESLRLASEEANSLVVVMDESAPYPKAFEINECKNCKPRPGGTIKTNCDGYCIECGKFIARAGVPLEAKEKPTAPASLVDEVHEKILDSMLNCGNIDGNTHEFYVDRLKEIGSRYRPQTDIVGKFKEVLEDALKTAEFENHPFRPWHHKAKEIISKHTKEGGV